MSITRRSFIKLGAFAGVFAGTNLLAPRFSAAQTGNSAIVSGDPLYSLTRTNFANYVGTDFSFVNLTDGANTVAVLSNITASKKTGKTPRSFERIGRGRKRAENFTLSFTLATEDDFRQATYLVQHADLGQFNFFLIPPTNFSEFKFIYLDVFANIFPVPSRPPFFRLKHGGK